MNGIYLKKLTKRSHSAASPIGIQTPAPQGLASTRTKPASGFVFQALAVPLREARCASTGRFATGNATYAARAGVLLLIHRTATPFGRRRARITRRTVVEPGSDFTAVLDRAG